MKKQISISKYFTIQNNNQSAAENATAEKWIIGTMSWRRTQTFSSNSTASYWRRKNISIWNNTGPISPSCHYKDTMAMITLHSFFYFAKKMKKVSGTDLLHLLTENVKNTHMMNSKMNCWRSWRKMCSMRKCQNNRTPVLCFDSWEIHRHIK